MNEEFFERVEVPNSIKVIQCHSFINTPVNDRRQKLLTYMESLCTCDNLPQLFIQIILVKPLEVLILKCKLGYALYLYLRYQSVFNFVFGQLCMFLELIGGVYQSGPVKQGWSCGPGKFSLRLIVFGNPLLIQQNSFPILFKQVITLWKRLEHKFVM